MTRPNGPSSAPPLRRRPKPGQDGLSSVLGVRRPAPSPDPYEPWVDHRVLELLGDAGKPLTIRELTERAKLSFIELSETLEVMESRSEIAVEGKPGSEMVKRIDYSGNLKDSLGNL